MGVNSEKISWYISNFLTPNNPFPADESDTTVRRPWELGVGVSIPNFHFGWPQKVAAENVVNAGPQNPSGAGYVLISFTSDAERQKYKKLIKARDFGQVSNDITRVGEPVRLSGSTVEDDVGGTFLEVYFTDNLKFNYTASESTLEIFTTNLAEKWTLDHEGLTPNGLYKELPTELTDFDGAFTSQLLSVPVGQYNTTAKKFSCVIPQIQEFAFPPGPGTPFTYRVGARYRLKFLTGDSGTVNLVLPGCTSTIKAALNYTESIVHKYYVMNSYPAFTDWRAFSLLEENDEYKKIQIVFTGASGDATTNSVEFAIDNIYLENSAGFESSLGCLLLTWVPDREAIDIGGEVTEELILLGNNDRYPYYPFGNPNRNRKYTIGTTFTFSNMDTYHKLKLLERYQYDGYKINLHPHLPELPEVLTGKMTIGKPKKPIWNFKQTAFDFFFEET